MKTMRVSGVIAVSIASRSWPKSFAGTTMLLAPRACVASGYTAKACCEYTLERPGARKAAAASSSTSFEPLPTTIASIGTPYLRDSAAFRSKALPSG